MGGVLWVGGAGVLVGLSSALSWLAWRAFLGAGQTDFWRVGAWVAGSLGIGIGGTILSFPVALAGALWTNSSKTLSVIRLCAVLPLSIPAFLASMVVAGIVHRQIGFPENHPLWAVFALAWGSLAPQWVRFSRALALPGLPTWREAASALGVPEHLILSGIALPAARRGILAGWLRSLARGSGETMVVLLVAGRHAGAAWTGGAALVREFPLAQVGSGLWLDLLRVAFLLGAWTVGLHLVAAQLDRNQSRSVAA